MKTLLAFFVLLAIVASLAPCEPFGLRLNYGRSIYDSSNPERLGVRFNTREECPHVELFINKFMIVHCAVRELSHMLEDYTFTGEIYKTYLHVCSLTSQIQFETDIEYNLFDSYASKKIYPQDIKINLKDPHKVLA